MSTTDSPKKTLVIAEAGVNHNGSLDLACQLVDSAADCGADVVKFQTFIATEVVTTSGDKAEYQKASTPEEQSQLEMLASLELSPDDHEVLISHCESRSIRFASTAFDQTSLKLLSSLNLPFIKIPSGEITNLPFIRSVAKVGKPVILSTGASTLAEVEEATRILRESGARAVTVLHCTSDYPARLNEVNLSAMVSMGSALDLPYGYSDHTMGISVPIAAVALGASVIEKHFTLDRSMPGPDHKASLNPDELKSMIDSIRNVEIALGDGIKTPGVHESENIRIIRRSIVASRPIKKGESLDESNITVKRPAGGRSPMEWDTVVGSVAGRSYEKDEWID